MAASMGPNPYRSSAPIYQADRKEKILKFEVVNFTKDPGCEHCLDAETPHMRIIKTHCERLIRIHLRLQCRRCEHAWLMAPASDPTGGVWECRIEG